jgi:hypothetical protein
VQQHETGRTGIDVGAAAQMRPALTFDFRRYQKYVADAGLSEAEEREYLQTLWDIVISFVDMGFDVHVTTETKEIRLEADSPSVVDFDNSDINDQDDVDGETESAQAMDS